MLFTTLLLSYFCLSFTIKNASYDKYTSDGISNTLLKKLCTKKKLLKIWLYFFGYAQEKKFISNNRGKCYLLL